MSDSNPTAQRYPLTGYGVIVPSERIPGAFASGADYAEPTIVGNLVVADGDGWTRHPDYDTSVRRGSFAILFPGDLSLADPGFPSGRVTAYLDAVMPIIGSVSEPGAKIMLEEEPLAVVQALGARIGHAHIADAGRRPPGQGDWPLTEFITALRDGGYDGPVTVECLFEDFEPELEAALAHLRQLA